MAVKVVVDRKCISAEFRQKLSAESLSVIFRPFGLSAERGPFGRKRQFLPKDSLSAETYFQMLAKRRVFPCRKRLFRQKEGLLAETASFGSFCISAESNFLEVSSFGFRQEHKIPLSVDHYLLNMYGHL